jgi:hypothetical protein
VPVVQRKQLRQALGRSYLRDTTVSTLTMTGAAITATVYIIDSTVRDPLLFDDTMYQRAWIKTHGFQFRIASFNCYSGAFIGAILYATTVASGAEYEMHTLIPPDEKDRAIDDAVKMMKFRQEVPVAGVANMQVYAIPDNVVEIYGVSYADSNASARSYSDFASWGTAMTGSGREIRVDPAITASQNLVIDALIEPTLGSADTATMWLPSDDWILSGAAVRAYWMLEAKAPGQQGATYRVRRQELTRRFNSLQHYYRPQVNQPIRMED